MTTDYGNPASNGETTKTTRTPDPLVRMDAPARDGAGAGPFRGGSTPSGIARGGEGTGESAGVASAGSPDTTDDEPWPRSKVRHALAELEYFENLPPLLSLILHVHRYANVRTDDDGVGAVDQWATALGAPVATHDPEVYDEASGNPWWDYRTDVTWHGWRLHIWSAVHAGPDANGGAS